MREIRWSHVNTSTYIWIYVSLFVSEGGSVSVPPLPSMALPTAQPGLSGQDRYAALAELDSALSSTQKATQG